MLETTNTTHELVAGLLDKASKILLDSGYKLIGATTSVKRARGYLLDCEKVANQHPMAVRIVVHQSLSPEYRYKFFPRQLSLITKLHHPNIIRTHKIIPQQDFTCIIVDRAPTTNLLEFITENGRLREPYARYIFHGILSAVQLLHSMKIAHRNIKCENVLMGPYGEPLLIDFGFARKIVDSVTKEHLLSETFCGSPAYAAPEIIRGLPYDPLLADVWSVGVVLYAMLIGMLPFDDANVAKMVKNQMHGLFVVPSDMSHECRFLLSGMLDPNPEKRMPLTAIACHPWLKI